MLYLSHVAADLTVVSCWPYDGGSLNDKPPADFAREIAQTEKHIVTPFAMAILADGRDGIWAAHCQGKSIDAAVAAGWRILRWGWSCHGFNNKQDGTSLENNYRLLVLGKWFKHEPVAPRVFDYPRCPWGGSGCSDSASNEWSDVKLHAGFYQRGMPKSIFTYYGPPLETAAYRKALADGWWRVPKTNVMLWAQPASSLTPAEKKRFAIKEDAHEDSE